jgi:hypothetical protein
MKLTMSGLMGALNTAGRQTDDLVESPFSKMTEINGRAADKD